jgi:hypothetical protein
MFAVIMSFAAMTLRLLSMFLCFLGVARCAALGRIAMFFRRFIATVSGFRVMFCIHLRSVF